MIRAPIAVTARANLPWPRAAPPENAIPLSHSTIPGLPQAAAAAVIAAGAGGAGPAAGGGPGGGVGGGRGGAGLGVGGVAGGQQPGAVVDDVEDRDGLPAGEFHHGRV